MPQNGVLPAQAQSIFFKEKQNKTKKPEYILEMFFVFLS